MEREQLLRLGAPILAAGTVFVAGKIIQRSYEAATGAPPPQPDDPETPMRRVLLYAVASAAVSAVINAAVTRMVAKAGQKQELPVV